jgi:predicted transcriptional regulator
MTPEELATIRAWARSWNPLVEGVSMENCCRAREHILTLVAEVDRLQAQDTEEWRALHEQLEEHIAEREHAEAEAERLRVVVQLHEGLHKLIHDQNEATFQEIRETLDRLRGR